MNDENTFLAWIRENMVIAIGAAIVVVALLGVGGYFLFSGDKSAPTATTASGENLSAEQQAAIEQGVCGVTVQRAKDYGVIPPDSSLSNKDAAETGRQGFVSCRAQSAQAQYAMVVQVACEDLANPDCAPLDSVKTSDGTSLYQRRPYSIQPVEPVSDVDAGLVPGPQSQSEPEQMIIPAEPQE